MKPKIIKQYSNEDYPYEIFSIYDNYQFNKNPHNIPNSSKHSQFLNFKPNRPLTSYTRLPSAVSSISKSLKSVTLSSQLYGDYINFHSNITQEHTFKTPRVNKYPLLKNEQFLPIKLQTPKTKDMYKDKEKDKISLSTDTTNSIFLSYMKEVKTTKKVIVEKPYGFKYGTTKIRFDRAKSANTFIAAKDFRELYEHNLFERKFLKQIGLKKIDMYNSSEEKKKNFKFFNEYLKKSNELKDILNENNFYRNITFNGRTAIKKENIDFKLEIYSLCFKFYSSDNNKSDKKECQKLYFPFELMPLFYLLDLTSFKVFLSEIITYNKNNNCFTYIKESIIIKKLRRYFNYISNSLENKPKYINNITYNKNEINFPLIYDWIISKNIINEEEENGNKKGKNFFDKNYQCFKVKIVLPKIIFNIDNLNVKIIKFLNKHLLANLLQNKFKKWQKFIFYDLFSTKRFKIITNLIMLNKSYRILEKKIHLYKIHKVPNKLYEFFLTQIGENNSYFYIFNPYTILILFGDKSKKFQKINLNLKESKNLDKFGKYWGTMNTLFKCMFIDTMKNKIIFKLDSLNDDKNELYKVVLEENSKQNLIGNNNINIDNELNNLKNGNSTKKITGKTGTIREKEKEKDNIQSKYKDNNFEISLLNCTFLKINITSNKMENKYYKIPSNLLKTFFSIKDENKIFNTDHTEITLISRCIGENAKSILSAKEADIISEEQTFIKKAKIKDDIYKIEKKEPSPRQPNGFNRLQSLLQNNINFRQETIKEETDIKGKNIKKIVDKKVNNTYKYLNPDEFELSAGSKKKVSISNLNSLEKNRIEYGIKNYIKRKSSKKNN